jgi:hypothetical protein
METEIMSEKKEKTKTVMTLQIINRLLIVKPALLWMLSELRKTRLRNQKVLTQSIFQLPSKVENFLLSLFDIESWKNATIMAKWYRREYFRVRISD